jgi:hypothetical protein
MSKEEIAKIEEIERLSDEANNMAKPNHHPRNFTDENLKVMAAKGIYPKGVGRFLQVWTSHCAYDPTIGVSLKLLNCSTPEQPLYEIDLMIEHTDKEYCGIKTGWIGKSTMISVDNLEDACQIFLNFLPSFWKDETSSDLKEYLRQRLLSRIRAVDY